MIRMDPAYAARTGTRTGPASGLPGLTAERSLLAGAGIAVLRLDSWTLRRLSTRWLSPRWHSALRLLGSRLRHSPLHSRLFARCAIARLGALLPRTIRTALLPLEPRHCESGAVPQTVALTAFLQCVHVGRAAIAIHART